MASVKRVKPSPEQESVWDYPRPPRIEESAKHIQVIFNQIVIADTHQAKRVLETSHPPVYYIPIADVAMQYFSPAVGSSFCEWKGLAFYYSIRVDDQQAYKCAWFYPDPNPEYRAIKDHLAFYPQLMDACYVDGELAKAQEGSFYGGWITKDIVGPFKGKPDTWGW